MLAIGLSAIACAPAFGANQTVMAVSIPDNAFVPASVTVNQGDTVTWQNDGGLHNVHFDNGSFDMPMEPLASTWTVSNVLAQPGSYQYYCELHGGPGGNGMAGTVVVNAAPPGGAGGGGGGGPGPGPGPGPDLAPVSSLVAPARQDVDRLFVRASMNEAGTLTATGKVSVAGGAAKAYTLRRVSRAVTAGQTVKLRLKLRKKALKAVKRALLRGRKLRAKITLTAKDASGKETRRKQTIRLTR
jgi:plastocyanin